MNSFAPTRRSTSSQETCVINATTREERTPSKMYPNVSTQINRTILTASVSYVTSKNIIRIIRPRSKEKGGRGAPSKGFKRWTKKPCNWSQINNEALFYVIFITQKILLVLIWSHREFLGLFLFELIYHD